MIGEIRVEQRVDVAVPERVVAERDRVDTQVEDLVRVARVQADAAGRVLAVDDDPVRLVAAAQLGQERRERPPAGRADDVTDEEQLHAGHCVSALPCQRCSRHAAAEAHSRDALLEARELTKRYGRREALRKVSLGRAPRREGRGHRAQRRGQDDAAVDPRGHPEGRRGDDQPRARARSAGCRSRRRSTRSSPCART